MRTRALALLNLGGTAVALAAGMSAPTLAWADVVINEFLPNPDGTDTGNEYVELYNSGSASVDLSGWVLQAGTSAPSDKFTVPDGISIAPGAFLVLGEELVADADLTTGTLSLGNAGSSGDIVRLLDSGGTVIDTVVYGPNNDDGFLDDTGALAVPGPKPGNGTALGRRPDGSDSDDSSVDFVDMPPSPGASNAPPAPDCDLADVADKVVVNELMPDPEGADAGLEWVELYNNGSATVDLSGWRVEAGTSDYGVVGTLPDGTTLPSRGFLLVGGDQVPSRDGELTGSLPNASSNADSVRIADCVGTPVDTVIYGATNEDGWTEDTGSVATLLAPKPSSGASLARRTDGFDADSGDDFVLQTGDDVSPRNPNPEPPPCELAPLVINELMADPEGTDGGFEWVELYNPSDSEITVVGWTLDAGTSSFTGGDVLPDVTIASGGYLLLGQADVNGADIVITESLGNGSSTSDGLQLRDCNGDVVDTVIYGSPNEDAFVDDTGAVATSLAPAPQSAASLSRLRDGYDNDENATDFAVESDPTPGAANNQREPIVCVPASGATVVLNEALVDAEGTDDGLEWFELYNPTDSPVRVDGWGLAAAGDGEEIAKISVSLPGGIEVPAGGYFVVAGPEAGFGDAIVPMSLGNGSGGDALVLYDCVGTRVDSVLYGGTNEDLLTDDLGETPDAMYVTSISGGASLARVDDGVDTDGPTDWYLDSTPSPGATNYQEVGDGPQPGGGCGRNGDPPDAGEPRNGCGSDEGPPALAGMALLVFGLTSLRRRRRRS